MSPGISLHEHLILVDQNILLERAQMSVACEFPASVLPLGRGGQNLDDHGGIKQCVEVAVLEPWLATYDHHVGVSVAIHRSNPDAQIAVVDFTWTVFELLEQVACEIQRNQAMGTRSPSHRLDHSVVELALELRPALESEILLGSESRDVVAGRR